MEVSKGRMSSTRLLDVSYNKHKLALSSKERSSLLRKKSIAVTLMKLTTPLFIIYLPSENLSTTIKDPRTILRIHPEEDTTLLLSFQNSNSTPWKKEVSVIITAICNLLFLPQSGLMYLIQLPHMHNSWQTLLPPKLACWKIPLVPHSTTQFLNEISEIKLPCFREWLPDKDTR
ncbi:hypothetical protein CDAR_85921 [Caerostris darwini]|uniref:Uncharacterized protein n=1 Tax=Caerostris darwini TaxID=1538125 RepID=A0AAV4UVP8_9ARAC|nr:hypothetical protein CDAR_85921 [Caerostris darwini]